MMSMPWHTGQFETLLQERDPFPHALLITGAEGTGKLAFAQAVAMALLCERPGPRRAACGDCPACLWYSQGNHPDFRLLEPARPDESGEAESNERKVSLHIEIAQVRALLEFLALSSHRGGARVVIVQPAEALTLPAANALLKGLEEPPAGTCFLLVTHRSHYLLPTIRSRCRRVPLAPPAGESALEWLRQSGADAPELALAHSGGAPLAASRFDADYWSARTRLLDRVAATDFDPLAAAEALKDIEPPVLVSLLQKWSFDLALHQTCGRIRYNPDRAGALGGLAARVDRIETARFHRRMVRLQRIVRHPLNARLFLEELLLDCATLLRGSGPRAA